MHMLMIVLSPCCPRSGFMDGLSASWIVVPILSSGSLSPMGKLFDEDGEPVDGCDNVLL